MIDTVGDLITFALRTAWITGVGQTPIAEDTDTALVLLRSMLATWQRRRWIVPNLADTGIVSTGAMVYGIGPGQPFNMARPDRLEAAYVRLLSPGLLPTSPDGLVGGAFWNNGGFVCVVDGSALPTDPTGLPDGSLWNDGGFLAIVGQAQPLPSALFLAGIDMPLTIIDSREDYNRIALKGLSTIPVAVFYDSVWPTGQLYFWPVPQASAYELHITTKAALPVYVALTDPINLPPEYIEALIYSLAVRLAMNYGLAPQPGHVAAMNAAMNVLRMANIQVPEATMPRALLPRRGSGMSARADSSFQSGIW